uniref:Peptidase n=1 Tax=viral metagenome TaxID=1070528 RepID=A0A6M3J3I8_9ZZZZ
MIKTVKILGVAFSLEDFEEEMRTDNRMGRCDIKTAKIILAKNMPTEIKEATFIHEAVHAVDMFSELGLTEKEVSAIGHCIYAVLKDNAFLKEDFLQCDSTVK